MASGMSGIASFGGQPLGKVTEWNMGHNGPPPKGDKPVGHVPPTTPVSIDHQHLPPDSYTTEYFECREGNHFKFWRVIYPARWANTGVWRVNWGRIGTDGQQKTFDSGNASAARSVARSKIDEKLGNGYTFVSRRLALGQDTSNPSPEYKATHDKHGYPLSEKKLAALTDAQRSAVITLYQAGTDTATIASTLHIQRQQVAAVVAHITMGTYGAQTGQKMPAVDQTSTRAFDWSE
jgi:predicted DNA-binding WGR domain protein